MVMKMVNPRQLDVLRWIETGCPEGQMRDDTYKVTAAALKKRRLVTISRSTGKWNAALTHVGVHFLDHGAYPDGHWVVSNAPTRIRPRRPSTAPVTGLSPVDQLLADVTEAGGCLVRTDAQWHQWENLVASAFRFRKVPAGKILTVERGDSWSERLIVMADSPECILRSVRATVPLSGEPLFRGGLSHCDVAD